MIEKTILKGHCDHISCIVFSKKYHWFLSGSKDTAIRSWKENKNKDWDSVEAEKKHTNTVICLLLNKKEDKLISCSYDHTI
jgi:WD40 repeat protein